MMGWKIAAMVFVVLGALLANTRFFKFTRRISSLREVVEKLFYFTLPLVIAGYFAFSFLPGKTCVGGWFGDSAWYKHIIALLACWGVFLIFFLNFGEITGGQEKESKETSIYLHVLKIVLGWLAIAMLITFLSPLAGIETSVFLLGGLALSITTQGVGKAIEKVFNREEAILAMSVLMICVATAIQIFILSP